MNSRKLDYLHSR